MQAQSDLPTATDVLASLDRPSTIVPSFDDQDPAKFVPNGDRYLVEFLTLREVSSGGVILPEASEDDMGWWPARIIAVGGEMRPEQCDPDESDIAAYNLRARPTQDADRPPMPAPPLMRLRRMAHRLERNVWVPMFWEVGQVVGVYMNTGAKMRILYKDYRIINQVEVLGRFPALEKQ
jgi:hypothetical protein